MDAPAAADARQAVPYATIKRPADKDEPYRRFVRSKPCVAKGPHCFGRVEFCHRKHSGMGGCNVPDRGNGFPACSFHHTQGAVSYHQLGRDSFAKKHNVDVDLVCAALLEEYLAGDFSP